MTRPRMLAKTLAACAFLAVMLMVHWQAPASPGHAADVVQVTTGHAHSCALLLDKTVKCWGSNSNGQLGDGTTIDRHTPVFVLAAPGGSPITDIASISAGALHTCAVTNGGAALCWGDNDYGQLGNGSLLDSTTPVAVSGMSSNTKAIGAGATHTCAVTTGGGAKCWGLNLTGQLGNGTINSSTTPVNVSGLDTGVAAIGAGGTLFWGHSCAAMTGGGAKCWGDNTYGQLGDGTTTARAAPVDVLASPGGSPIGGIAGITLGTQHSCAPTGAGGAKCWGANASGQLGDGSTTDRTTPVDVSGLTGVQSVSAGASHTCAFAGAAKCWGSNTDGQLGDGTMTNRTTPVTVSGLTSHVVGIAGGGLHSCAVRDGGAVECWGANGSGQLGNGTTTGSTTPVTVSGFDKPVGGIAAPSDLREAPSAVPERQGPPAGLIAALTVAALALLGSGAFWYAKGRRPS